MAGEIQTSFFPMLQMRRTRLPRCLHQDNQFHGLHHRCHGQMRIMEMWDSDKGHFRVMLARLRHSVRMYLILWRLIDLLNHFGVNLALTCKNSSICVWWMVWVKITNKREWQIWSPPVRGASRLVRMQNFKFSKVESPTQVYWILAGQVSSRSKTRRNFTSDNLEMKKVGMVWNCECPGQHMLLYRWPLGTWTDMVSSSAASLLTAASIVKSIPPPRSISTSGTMADWLLSPRTLATLPWEENVPMVIKWQKCLSGGANRLVLVPPTFGADVKVHRAVIPSTGTTMG